MTRNYKPQVTVRDGVAECVVEPSVLGDGPGFESDGPARLCDSSRSAAPHHIGLHAQVPAVLLV